MPQRSATIESLPVAFKVARDHMSGVSAGCRYKFRRIDRFAVILSGSPTVIDRLLRLQRDP